MPEFFTDWTQLPTMRTRQRNRIQPGLGQVVQHRQLQSQGIITYAQFLSLVYGPSLDTAHQSNGIAPATQASAVQTERWLTTPYSPLPGVEAAYDTSQRVSGSVSHVHDYDPMAWEVATRVGLIDDFQAEHPTAFGVQVQWETNPFTVQPWGIYANRMIELQLSQLSNSGFNRNGSVGSPPAGVLDHGLILRPYAGEPGTYTFIEDTGDGWWEASGLEAEGFDLSMADAQAAWEPTGDPFGSGTTTFALSDSWWTANAWPVEGRPSSFYNCHGLPLLIGPAMATVPNYPDPFGPGEFNSFYSASGLCYFEEDWTPPRYRIRYLVNSRPVVRQWPRDDGRGWSSAPRLYPPTKATRAVGGYQ